jgi:4,5-DOPA dioxygenase extradiol
MNICCRCLSHSGAGGEASRKQRFHAGIDDYVIAMDAYSFLPQKGGRP